MKRSIEQLKHIDRTSRQNRQHRLYLNQIYDQKLSRELHTLTTEHAQMLRYSKKQRKLEQQRKQVLDITIRQITSERNRQPVATPDTNRILPKIHNKTNENPNIRRENLQNRPSSSSSTKLFPTDTSCRLFSHDCQLYPCQPVYHYTSFMTKNHDQTLRQRQPCVTDSDSSDLQNLFTQIEEKKYHQNRRQLAVTIKNQHHLANRHAYMVSTKARLDEQSRSLHERLTNNRTFCYVKDDHKELRRSIQRHLEISAKFCA